jgi:hypothetical protein
LAVAVLAVLVAHAQMLQVVVALHLALLLLLVAVMAEANLLVVAMEVLAVVVLATLPVILAAQEIRHQHHQAKVATVQAVLLMVRLTIQVVAGAGHLLLELPVMVAEVEQEVLAQRHLLLEHL